MTHWRAPSIEPRSHYGSWSGRPIKGSHWVGELGETSILESEYILLMAFLGRESDPVCVRWHLPISRITSRRAAGGRSIHGRSDRNRAASVKAYSALKLVGKSRPDDPAMVHERGKLILDAGARARVQQLHTVLPGASGPDRLRRMPLRSSRAGLDSFATWLEGLSRTMSRVDADDRGPAFDHGVF